MMLNKQKHPPPRLLLHRVFSDISTLGKAVEFDLDFRQLEAGKLHARIVLLAGRRTMAMRVEFNRKFHQRGAPPNGTLTFGLPDPTSGSLRWNNQEVTPGVLINFNNGRLDGVNTGNFGGYTLSFTEDLLREVAVVLGIDLDISSCIQDIAFWGPQNSEHYLLRRKLRFIERATVTETAINPHTLAEVFDFDLAASVVRILARGSTLAHKETAPFRTAALKRALLLIDDQDQCVSSVAGLCASVGASWGTLERAFADEFGVTPKAYIQSKRLAAVRRQLIISEADTSITEVANRWNFWHSGRFAADYCRQFGELPSQTLISKGR
jgi:AraC family ethanolamine operon transcriptional activator